MIIALLLIGLVAGVAGGLFGIGGGLVMVPAMILLLGFEQKLSNGTSLGAQLLPVSLLAGMVYYREGNLNIRHALLLAVGLLLGQYLGALFANNPSIPAPTMKKLYGAFLLIIGAYFLFVTPPKRPLSAPKTQTAIEPPG